MLSELLKDNLLTLLAALSHVIDESNLINRNSALHLLSNIATNSEREANQILSHEELFRRVLNECKKMNLEALWVLSNTFSFGKTGELKTLVKGPIFAVLISLLQREEAQANLKLRVLDCI